jgi:glutamate racemase
VSGAIGVFDSGVGGLTVFRALERALPGRPLIYLGDTARVPYGTRSPETVVRYSLEAARFMQQQGVGMLVVACNTASSVAIRPVADEAGLPVLGVILPGADRAVELTGKKRIGVIGTRATIGSGAYERAIRSRLPGAEVISRACPLFVPLAEEGWTENDVALQVAETYLAPLRAAEIDTLVLGCTHYPLLSDVIAEVMGDGVRLVDSAETIAARVRDELAPTPSDDDAGETEHHFYVTDAPEPFQAVAERFLGRPIRRLERAAIDSP